MVVARGAEERPGLPHTSRELGPLVVLRSFNGEQEVVEAMCDQCQWSVTQSDEQAESSERCAAKLMVSRNYAKRWASREQEFVGAMCGQCQWSVTQSDEQAESSERCAAKLIVSRNYAKRSARRKSATEQCASRKSALEL